MKKSHLLYIIILSTVFAGLAIHDQLHIRSLVKENRMLRTQHTLVSNSQDLNPGNMGSGDYIMCGQMRPDSDDWNLDVDHARFWDSSGKEISANEWADRNRNIVTAQQRKRAR